MDSLERGAASRLTGWGPVIGGAVLLLGLSGCGGAPSDQASGPSMSAVTDPGRGVSRGAVAGRASDAVLVEPAGSSPASPAQAGDRLPGFAEAEREGAPEARTEPETDGAGSLGTEPGVTPATPVGGRSPAAPSSAEQDAQREVREHQREAREQWYAAMREAPEAGTRRFALEVWAQQPDDALDPVTYGLVDEDDTVRARAQELYEQYLQREAQQGQTP